MRVDVTFDFLENRDYIHSTSWLYKLLDILQRNNYIHSYDDVEKISAVFRAKKNKQGYYLINEPIQNEDIIFHLYTSSEKIQVCYVENNRDKVTSRIPYDEDFIVKNGVIHRDDLSAYIQISCLNNLYNVIVALNKKLLLNILPKDGYFSWTVGKFSINWHELHSNAIGKKLIVKLINNINDMYCKSNIYMDEKLIGSIDYARKKIIK